MRTFTLTITRLVLFIVITGYGSRNNAQTRAASAAPTNKPVSKTVRQPTGSDGSPIIISDGSLHLRQWDNAAYALDIQHLYINLGDHRVDQIEVGTCDTGGDKGYHSAAGANVKNKCTFVLANTYLVPGRWLLQVLDSSGTAIESLGAVDTNGMVAASVSNTSYVLNGELDNQDDGNKRGDGEGWTVACSPPSSASSGSCTDPKAANVVLTLMDQVDQHGQPLPPTQVTVPCSSSIAADGTPVTCTIRIRYCRNGKIGTKDCTATPDPAK